MQAASDYGTYVATHVYTPAGIARAVEAGVASIEHGHLADEATVAPPRREGRVAVDAALRRGGPPLSPTRCGPRRTPRSATAPTQVYAWAKKHGVKTAWGTDLLLEPQSAPRQSVMAARLGEFYTNLEALKMLTSGNAALFELAGERNSYRGGKLGVIAEGAWADMILVDGDPIADLSLIANPEVNFKLIVKGGQVIKNTL